jgi:hypothetical protein
VVSDGLILAAVERALRHEGHRRSVVLARDVFLHLGLLAGSRGERRVRARMRVMAEMGWLGRSRPRGVEVWLLTDAGREQLAGLDVGVAWRCRSPRSIGVVGGKGACW